MTMTTSAEVSAPADTFAPAEEEISLYEAIGGRLSVVAAVDVFFRRLLADPELGRYFPDGVDARHRRYLATFLGEALGGPRRYRGPDIATAHRGLGITDAQFDRTAACLIATLDELGVPGHLADRIVGIVAGLRQAVVTG